MEEKRAVEQDIKSCNKLVLKKPIYINNEEFKEIPYNLEDMTYWDKERATKEYQKSGGVGVVELDSNYHFYLFAAAVKKVNPDIETSDLMSMSAKDCIRAEAIVRDFFFITLEDTSPKNT